MAFVSLFLYFLLFKSWLLESHTELPITINMLHENELVALSHDALDKSSNGIAIEAFKFYLSDLELYNGSERVYASDKAHYLIDAEQGSEYALSLKVPSDLSFSHVQFHIGVDSITNVSGAFGGDLDPTNGMYWTWQSGYINFKLEGRSNDCPANKNRFLFHIGGYEYPYNTQRLVRLKAKSAHAISINLELDKIFDQINLEKTHQIMSPNKNAVDLANVIPELFSVAE